MAGAPQETEAQKSLKRRFELAKRDRARRQELFNEVFRLAMPWRRRLGEQTERTLNADDVSDMLDGTLADTLDDFASDMMATFTPPHEPWVLMEPTVALKPQERQAIAGDLKEAIDWFWEDLGQSSFYDAADECYHDLGAGLMAIVRKDYGADQPVCWEHTEPASLYIDHGPNKSIDGRWQEFTIERRLWEPTYGKRIKLPAKYNARGMEGVKLKVVDGTHRIWEQKGDVAYRRVILVDGKIVHEHVLQGDGSVQLIAGRWRSDGGSAYGVGPAWKACPAQRVLNEITALHLANLHKVVDPPVAYSDDGTANIEESGVDAGDWVNLGENFKIEVLEAKGRFDVSFFAQDDLRTMVRRALYQDKPEQKGKTPPTAEQWVDERLMSQQRFEVPRGKIFREWTIPIVKAHLWLRQRHGIMPQIGNGIVLKPVSPNAKARAFEKVAKGERVMRFIVGSQPEKAAQVIDMAATTRNMKRLLDDDMVVVRDDAQQQEIGALVEQGVRAAIEQMQAAQGAAE